MNRIVVGTFEGNRGRWFVSKPFIGESLDVKSAVVKRPTRGSWHSLSPHDSLSPQRPLDVDLRIVSSPCLFEGFASGSTCNPRDDELLI
jgi:hypothetical protein